MSQLKWPRQLDLVRHAQSDYNRIKDSQINQPLYKAFLEEYGKSPHSSAAVELAEQLVAEYAPLANDPQTPITEEGMAEALATGRYMAKHHDVPDVIFVSPYLRTKQTLSQLIKAWPELSSVRIIEEERIREKEFGLRLLYSDHKIFYCLHPDQNRLYQVQGRYWYRQPQGENIPDMRLRLRSWSNSLTRDYAGKRVLAVTHHLTILAFRANQERLSADQFIQLDKTAQPGNASITTYRGQIHQASGQQRLRLVNYDVRPAGMPSDDSAK